MEDNANALASSMSIPWGNSTTFDATRYVALNRGDLSLHTRLYGLFPVELQVNMSTGSGTDSTLQNKSRQMLNYIQPKVYQTSN